jgi:hypothetical protein
MRHLKHKADWFTLVVRLLFGRLGAWLLLRAGPILALARDILPAERLARALLRPRTRPRTLRAAVEELEPIVAPVAQSWQAIGPLPQNDTQGLLSVHDTHQAGNVSGRDTAIAFSPDIDAMHAGQPGHAPIPALFLGTRLRPALRRLRASAAGRARPVHRAAPAARGGQWRAPALAGVRAAAGGGADEEVAVPLHNHSLRHGTAGDVFSMRAIVPAGRVVARPKGGASRLNETTRKAGRVIAACGTGGVEAATRPMGG